MRPASKAATNSSCTSNMASMAAVNEALGVVSWGSCCRVSVGSLRMTSSTGLHHSDQTKAFYSGHSARV